MAGFAFTRALRLTEPAAFQQVFAENERFHATGLTLLARPSPLGHARLGLAIAKKHVRLASDRNAIKRAVREAFRLAQPALPARDVIVLAKPGVDRLAPPELRRQVQLLLTRLARSPSAAPPSDRTQG
ncbi:ribonuclease P protein component [Permianibacter sp. IMCC34836]|nr:ribonuclease P protein component [Permianibacter fluminis]